MGVGHAYIKLETSSIADKNNLTLGIACAGIVLFKAFNEFRTPRVVFEVSLLLVNTKSSLCKCKSKWEDLALQRGR